jgi:hypothetical protein
MRIRGTMLWFNEKKDVGALRTDEGERIDVPGPAFAAGEKPVGRCAGKAVEFDSLVDSVDRVVFIPETRPRRARLRRHR